jgi:ABC-type sugar transport system substrate-binding protein
VLRAAGGRGRLRVRQHRLERLDQRVFGGGSSSSADSQAQNVVDTAMKPWTRWDGPTRGVAPRRGVNLALVACAGTIAGCTAPVQEAQKAAESIGWNVKTYDGRGDPVAQNQVVTQAINSGADAVIMAGIDPRAISSALDLARERGVPVGSMTQGIAPGDGIAFDVGGNYVDSGKIIGSWIIADSDGKAVVLPTNDKEFASTQAIVDTAVDTVRGCSGCQVKDTQYFVGSNIGNGLGQRIAEQLQRDPDVNYVIGAFDPATADMVPAIQNAGIGSRVKIISNVGLTQNLQYIADDNVQAADIVYDNTYVGYAAVDQMIRTLARQPLWRTPGESDPRYMYGEGVPQHLTTKENVGDPNKPWTADIDTAARFAALWGGNG